MVFRWHRKIPLSIWHSLWLSDSKLIILWHFEILNTFILEGKHLTDYSVPKFKTTQKFKTPVAINMNFSVISFFSWLRVKAFSEWWRVHWYSFRCETSFKVDDLRRFHLCPPIRLRGTRVDGISPVPFGCRFKIFEILLAGAINLNLVSYFVWKKNRKENWCRWLLWISASLNRSV